ncbi:hypothetical protein CORT_0A09180 [Candida orthopsilosis Co 90-125]|uniref:Uncharacterized protein n=1 Tax=Candida orthopsilosis (strain 90-125) TaxID=1136231 RepID=H8WYI7_CANO9|nr:hypothetical protein CORT_0A09180 [Candida orthopsilosis Co 90-125]CCG21302.1 hypothetical protein CORT_0A09180 [Candida orthopsilosis Co 90-125]
MHQRFYTTNSKPEPRINPHTVFYRQFSKPFLKICALSLGTYYGLIYTWEYLEKKDIERDQKRRAS